MKALNVFNKSYRHSQRSLAILRVLSKYGFYDLMGWMQQKVVLKEPEGASDLPVFWLPHYLDSGY